MRKLLSLSLMALATSSVFAGGYRVSLQGQKQLAMGHTGVAVVNSAESLFFNPAGISFLENKFNVSVGGNALFANVKFQNETYNWNAESKNVGTPFSVYATYKVTDWLSVGLAVYTPYGSAVDWDQDWQGSHLVNNIDLEAIYVQPTVAIKINDKMSIAGGPIFVTGHVKLNKNIDRSMADENGNRTDVSIEAKGVTAWGWNAGLMFNPTDHLRIGFNYRSEITMEARGGDATFNDVPAYAQGTLTNTTFDANLPLPAEITVGLSYEFTNKLLVAFDYNRTQWGVYKDLTVQFHNAVGTSVNPRNYKDSNAYRFGAQYKATDKVVVRGGYYIDESPVQAGYFAPETPRNDSRGYTAGMTYQFNKRFGVDLSLLYLHFKQTNSSYDHFVEGGNEISFGGTYKSAVFSPGVGITYGF